MATADEFTEKLFAQIDRETQLQKEKNCCLSQWLRETTLIELFIINNHLQDLLQAKEVTVVKTLLEII